MPYLDGLQIELKKIEKSIAETISCARKKKRVNYFQSLKDSCEHELQGLSCHAFTSPFFDHPLFSHIVFLIKELQREVIFHDKILFCMRKVLAHPAYTLHKRDDSHPFIHFLHSLCLASYTASSFSESYREIGDHLAALTYKMISSQSEKNDEELTLSQFLFTSRVAAKKAGLVDNDYTLQYAVKHPKMLISALLSKSWGRVFSWIKKFDPKGFAGNIPGAFFEEKLFFSDCQTQTPLVTARTIYSPTPSLGEAIVPEAMAMLQAMENRHFLSSEQLRQERYPYLAWVYVNLQDLTHSNEKGRSRNLMRLTRQYPHSFRAITVTQDAGLYRYQAAGQYKEKMRENLLDEANFTLEGGLSGYCFPCRSLQEKKKWKHDLAIIVDIAGETVEKSLIAGDLVEAQVVFCELVTLAIVRYFHLRSGRELLEARPFVGDISYLVTTACKESIDRGGKINALMLLGKGKREPEIIKTAFSCLHARALSVRSRLIKKDRMMQLCSLLSAVPHDELQQFFCKIDTLAQLFRSEVNVLL